MVVLLPAGSVVIAACQLLSGWVIARKRSAGWLLSIGATLLSVPYDSITRQYGFIATAIVSDVIAVQAYRSWRADATSPSRPEAAGRSRGTPTPRPHP